ncbi:Hydroxysteroid dehydrogenase-like protein 2 [Nymphon striatum]|nr:Hydroxysteroid dehydrogenase-like protein 2 [Nymphon striatum]
MSNIPEERLGYQQSAFYYTGLDIFGPFMITRKRSSCKAWGLLLTCMTTRAIHLEKLEGLDTSSFLNGLERFFSRRGLPKKITCDNAPSFKRGQKELQAELHKLNSEGLTQKLANANIEFSYIPPYSSHFGGVYERQIRTVRQVLQSMLFDQQFKVTDDVMNTFFCQVEAIVNTRPISPLHNRSNDEPALRPIDFLVPKCSIASLPIDASTVNCYTKAWKRVHAMLDCFWRRWLRSYLPLLQQRSKWWQKTNNQKIGDIVLVVDPNAARADWKLGKVTAVKFSEDGLVRSVEVLCHVEAAGGKCFPCIVDVRNEEQVQSAVEGAVKKFGGIDILVNNASAISLTGTLATTMKTYDLMHNINTRGTYVTSMHCIPYLKSSKNPHILNISPPLSLNPRWFEGHVAYTMAKYGMSMCVLGMAGEFKKEGIAVNALWPKTAILTAAMEMLGGKNVAQNCRKPEIMADAAYVLLTRDSKSYTGNFCVDENVLSDVGITDFDQYAVNPSKQLIPDYFLDEDPKLIKKQIEMTKTAKPAGADISIDKVFDILKTVLNDDLIQQTKGVYLFEVSGAEEGNWHIDLKNGSGSAGKGESPAGPADCSMKLSSDDFIAMFRGKLNPTNAFMQGKLKISGNMALAMKLEKLMGSMKGKL